METPRDEIEGELADFYKAVEDTRDVREYKGNDDLSNQNAAKNRVYEAYQRVKEAMKKYAAI